MDGDVTVIESRDEIVEEKSENVQDTKKKSYPSKGMLSIRIVVGAYILYNMYEIIVSDSEKSVLIYVLVAALTVAAGIIIVMSIIHYIKGEYSGGKADKAKNEDATISAVKTDSEDVTISADIAESEDEQIDVKMSNDD